MTSGLSLARWEDCSGSTESESGRSIFPRSAACENYRQEFESFAVRVGGFCGAQRCQKASGAFRLAGAVGLEAAAVPVFHQCQMSTKRSLDVLGWQGQFPGRCSTFSFRAIPVGIISRSIAQIGGHLRSMRPGRPIFMTTLYPHGQF
jgi:hypothetical protein